MKIRFRGTLFVFKDFKLNSDNYNSSTSSLILTLRITLSGSVQIIKFIIGLRNGNLEN
jgi:hypothetical protein